MGAVQLDGLEPDAAGTFRRCHERLSNPHKLRDAQSHWRILPLLECKGRRRVCLPAVRSVRRNLGAASPGHFGRSLPPGVRQLYRNRNIGVAPYALHGVGDRGLRLIGPQADVGVGDPAFRQHGRGFDGEQRRS